MTRNLGVCFLLGIACIGATPIRGQAPLKPRPAVGPPKSFTVPRVQERTYPNGMRIALVPFRATPTARLELVIRAGTADEGSDQLGVAQILGQYLLEGTQSRSAESIAQLVSDLGAVGGAISVNADAYETTLAVDVLPEGAPRMIELLADVVQHPSFPAAALERLKLNTVRRLQNRQAQADWLASSRINSLLFPGNAADRVATEAQIKALTSEVIARFFSDFYTPGRSRLYIAGTFDQSGVERAAEVAFGGWVTRGSRPFALPQPSDVTRRLGSDSLLIRLIDRPGSTQARIQVSFPVVDLPHPEHLALNEINTLMGSSQTARIVANIRERNGYSYNISTRLVRRPGSTQWIVAGDITNNVVGAALQEILSEIAKLRAEAPPAAELREFQTFMAGILVSENSTAPGILESLRWMDLYGVDNRYFGSFIQNVYGISPADVQRVASRYLTTDRMVIVVVGDRKVLLPQLQQLGRVVD